MNKITIILQLSLLAGLLICCSSDDVAPKIDFSLASRIDIPGENTTDVWGYEANGRAYAIVGDFNYAFPYGSVSIVDVTDAFNPILLSTTPLSGFDMKVWGHYLFVGDGTPQTKGEEGGKILDIIDPANPVVVGSFPSCHNLFIDDQGYMYLAGSLDYIDSTLVITPALRIYDLNINPIAPVEVWIGRETKSHDVSVIGDRLFLFRGRNGTSIYDVSDRTSPRLISTIDLPLDTYDHSGWVSEDGNYLFICNEFALSRNIELEDDRGSTILEGVDIAIWDISEPNNPTQVGEIHDDNTRVHNLYIVDNYAYVSYYDAGLRIYNISNPKKPTLNYEYDTNEEDINSTDSEYLGAFGVFPFTSSGNIYVSDVNNGLFVFSKNP
jgi:choice-of-anchor B domain-containing protein